MIDKNTRINAAISYLFLGPLMLLAKKGTPFFDPFVRNHAKKSSLILLVASIFWIIFIQFQSILSIGIFGLSLYTIISVCILLIFFTSILYHSYRAYLGVPADKMFQFSENIGEFSLEKNTYSETEKAQIILSFFPFLGIILSAEQPKEEILIGRKIGNFLTFLILFSGVIFGGFLNFISIGIILIYSIIIATTIAFLFTENSFFYPKIYQFIPTYYGFESGIIAGIIIFFEYIQIAFGKQKTYSFWQLQQEFKNDIIASKQVPENINISPKLIGIPFINLIFLGSLFKKSNPTHHANIIEGITLTIGIIVFWFLFGQLSVLLWIFAIVTIVVFAPKTQRIHAPMTGFSLYFFKFLIQKKRDLIALQKSKKEQSFTFNTENSNIIPKNSNPTEITQTNLENTNNHM